MADHKFIGESLAAHNEYRARHGVAPLKHNPNLDKSAQEWALKLLGKINLENSPISNKGEVGENISMRVSPGKFVEITGKEVTTQWYGDIKGYDFKTASGKAGNFTQLVWAGTQEFGIGKAQKDGKCIIVAHYKPPGNVRGRYAENVKPVCSDHGTADNDTSLKDKAVKEAHDEIGNISQGIKETKINDSSTTDSSDEDHPADKHKNKDLVKFIHETISAHNASRKLHGCPPLKHNRDLDALAQEAAETLARQAHLSNSNHMYKNDRLGENIASRWSNGPCDYGGNEVVDHWFQEGQKYNYAVEPTNVQGIGNFTQVIWKGSKEIGVGKAFHTASDGTKVIVVCHYYPAGNVLQCFKDNVPKPR